MKSLQNIVLPAQWVVLLALPAIMVAIVNIVLSSCIWLLSDLSFREISSSAPVLYSIMYAVFAIVTGIFMWCDEFK